jgi:hypothetical protein
VLLARSSFQRQSFDRAGDAGPEALSVGRGVRAGDRLAECRCGQTVEVAHGADRGLVDQEDRAHRVRPAVGALDRPREGRMTTLRCATLPAFMNPPKTITKHTVAASELDPATLASLNVLKRQRQRMNRTLLKRRRQKSGQ